MSVFLSSNEFWDQVYQEVGFPNAPRGKRDLVFKKDYGEIQVHHFNTGFGIRYSSVVGLFHEDIVAESINSNDCNFLCFNNGDDIYMEDAIKNKKVKWDSNICWSGEQFVGHKCNSFYPKGKQIQLHYVSFDNELFQETVQNNDNFSKTQSVYKGEYIDVNFNNYINTQQKHFLNDLLDVSSLEGDKLQEIYLESKLLELVYTSFNSIEVEKNENSYLNQKDRECLFKAKEILLSNITNPPSLKELSYKSAINEFKLKKGFKELFGITVYGMLHEVRLEQAQKLLRADDINVQEAAHMVGYKNLSHFSKIFKEHYGKLPGEFKKNKIL
jgi:AraC-like DNA-binding protein